MRLKMRGYSTNFMLPTLAEETDLKMPGKTPAPQKEDRRRVQFNMEPTVHPVEHLNDISDRQIQAVWISFDEMAAIKQSYANIVKIMMRLREQFVEDLGKGICARGLGTCEICFTSLASIVSLVSPIPLVPLVLLVVLLPCVQRHLSLPWHLLVVRLLLLLRHRKENTMCHACG